MQPCNTFPTLNQSIGPCRRRQWNPTPALLPGKSHGRRSLVGCSPWGCEELDMDERLHFHFSLLCIGEGNGNPLQCSCLENPRDGVAQSWTRLKWLSSHWSMYGSNCCFLICIQASQEAGKVICYSQTFKNFPQFVVVHRIKVFSIVNEAEVDVFVEFFCFLWSEKCWQFDLWFLCLF